MKKLSLSLLLLIPVILAKAQTTTFRPVKVDLTYGVAIPTGNGPGSYSAGPVFTLEPHYRISDKFAVGVRGEFGGLSYQKPGESSSNTYFFGSYGLSGNYYLSNGLVRPFVGLGLGFYAQSEFQIVISRPVPPDPTITRFDTSPMFGIEAGHLRIDAEYNIISNNMSFLAIKVGFFFGGGRKKEHRIRDIASR